MQRHLPFLLIFISFGISLLLFGFRDTKSAVQEPKFIGLFSSAEQKWGLTPAVFGKMQTQLQNKIKVYAFYSDGTINRDLNMFTPGVDDPVLSKIEHPGNWGTWKNGETSKEGTGYVLFRWKEQPNKNDTVVVYPLPKIKKGYTLEGRYDMYVTLKDKSDKVYKYTHLIFEKDGDFKMKNFNRFLTSYEKVPFENKDCGRYAIDNNLIVLNFNDGRKVVTTFSHIPPKKEGGSDMLFIGGDHGFKKRQ